jgi:hypothetical protein
MKRWVFRYAYGTSAITKKWDLGALLTKVFATLMALVLSQRSGIWVHSSPKSLKVYEIHNKWEQQLAAATYSASVVD